MGNDGADWIGLKSLSIDNLAPQANAAALADGKWMMARVSRNDKGTNAIHVDLSAVPLPSGDYNVTEVNLQTGETKTFKATVNNSSVGIELSNADEVLVFSQ